MSSSNLDRENKRQKSESFTVGALLAISGGILDAYTYLCRGKVFANAQTGNIVLVGINSAEGNWKGVFSAMIPVVAFMLGVLVTELTRHRIDNDKLQRIHWRHFNIFLEIALLAIIALIPLGHLDHLVNIVVSFVCSIQVQTFRKVHGNPFATTMCTGNLRSGTEALLNYIRTGNGEAAHKSLCAYGLIGFFVLGAIVGALLSGHIPVLVIPLVIVIYAVVFLMMTEWKLQ
ncbi:MAG: YoaK family protein [Clostridia bacterium]|nr:YoaK family protein [Clostridia bacterium]